MNKRDSTEVQTVDLSWRDDAHCRTVPQRDMFPPTQPERGKVERPTVRSYRLRMEDIARGHCARCPVAVECRSFALQHPHLATAGVWGGLTEAERRTALRLERRERSGR